jgi:hypothetical protein
MILQVDDAIAKRDCARLIEVYRHYARRAEHRDYCGNAVIYLRDLYDVEPAIGILQSLAQECAATIGRRFDLSRRIFPETVVLTRLARGGYHVRHADNCRQDDEGRWVPNHTPNRHISAVYYLNGDFEGGEIVFEKHDLVIKPHRGLLVAFPSNRRYIHEVRAVRSGYRYTLALWFTRTRKFALLGFA